MKTKVVLTKKELIANETMAFHFEKPIGFEFRAGQFGDITLIDPPETDGEGNVRGFSIASAPFEDELIFATRLRDTAFKRVFRTLPEGSEVELDAPYGDFTLHKNSGVPAIFVIGGIGVTPVRSIIAQATHDKTAHKITLVHSSRTPDDMPFLADFEELSRQNSNFEYIPVASDQAPENWSGRTGRIDQELLAEIVANQPNARFYLSGPEGMVKAMRAMLIEIGADEDNIRTEEFSGY